MIVAYGTGARGRHVRALLGVTTCACLLLLGAIVVHGAMAGHANHVPVGQSATGPGTSQGGAGTVSSTRSTCSPQAPFNPPIVATLAAGVLALDRHGGRAIVVAAPPIQSASFSVTMYDTMTGVPLLSRVVTSTLEAPHGIPLSAATYVALDATTGRVFVLRVPYGVGQAPAGGIDVLDERTLALVHSVPVGGRALQPVVDERTGRVFVASGQDGTISVLDARTGALLRTTRVARSTLGPPALPVIDDRSGHVFVAANTVPGAVSVLDAQSGALLRNVPVGAAPRAIALDAGIGHILVGEGQSNGGNVRVLDARNGVTLRAAALPGSPAAMLVDGTTHRAFVTYSDNPYVSVIDATTGRVIKAIRARDIVDIIGTHVVTETVQLGTEMLPVISRIDEARGWVVVQVPELSDDDGPIAGSEQEAVLDSRTGEVVHRLATGGAWPDAIAVDDERGRAFSNLGSTIDLYDVSCIKGHYLFANL